VTDVRIRAATADDRPFMFGQAARLAAVAGLPWHAERDLLAFQHRYMNAALARPASETASFIAEDESSQRLGFVHAEASTDFVTLEPCAYVTVLAVIEAAEGKGVAARLMAAAEDWGRRQGFRLICLDVFASNRRARAFYARQGYQEDSLRVTKPL
jgi:GNAT superfamily N-acetyltransferase